MKTMSINMTERQHTFYVRLGELTGNGASAEIRSVLHTDMRLNYPPNDLE